jgi:flagellar P-ring protein FlgI
MTMKKIIRVLCASAAFLTVAYPVVSEAARIKDMATIKGVRSNALIGYGLVVGLDGTGDQVTQSAFTRQSIESMLGNQGINLPPGVSLQTRNTAAVMVTASLPAYARAGQTLDVTVSSISNAKSLRGGTLLMTPLKGPDGQVYALAQGNMVVGGAGAEAGKSSVRINHLSAGRVPEGATIERNAPTISLSKKNMIELELADMDYATAAKVAEAINAKHGAVASAVDGRVIEVNLPIEERQRVAFLGDIQEIQITKALAAAKVVVNSRTGSVVMNQNVKVLPCAISHGNLTVTVKSTPVISQPGAFSQGQTVESSVDNIEINQTGGELIEVKGSNSLRDVVKALNVMGATPQDLISIIQAMKEAGSLQAELQVI